MLKRSLIWCVLMAPAINFAADAITPYYSSGLCEQSGFECIKVQAGQSWEKLFPDENQRDIVQRINRSYNYLQPGKVLAVPKQLDTATLLDFSPFAREEPSIHEKEVIIDQDKLAWGAYDEKGQLVKWGPIASGRAKCSDSNHSCLTMPGVFRVFSKEDKRCTSAIFPIGRGGAKMPYCMYFHKGFAMHGSSDMPGYRASHGCVRMFERDAKWLNLDFVEAGNKDSGRLGTKVVVRPVTWSEPKNVTKVQ